MNGTEPILSVSFFRTASGNEPVREWLRSLPRDQLIDFDYCLQAIRIRPDVAQLVSGSTRANLNQEIAASIPVPLPPLAEQKRIAGILKEQMAAVERARRSAESQLDAINKLPAALLREAFYGNL